MKFSARSHVIAGLGSNLGERLDLLRRTLLLIREHAGEITAQSSIWESEPWGFEADEHFLNMAVTIDTTLAPMELLQLFRSIEGRLGRKRSGRGRYESRTIDIDILLWGQRIISLPALSVPHPALADRKFVLLPLMEIAPAERHPVTGFTVKEMFDQCHDNSSVRLSALQL